MPLNARDKGNRGEREVAKTINRYLGTNCRRTPLSGGLSIKGDIIDINPDSIASQYHFEIKNTKKLSIPMWWKQIYSDCGKKIPVNIFKMNAKFYTTLELKDWLSGLAETQELQESNAGLEALLEEEKKSNKILSDRIEELERELYK